jgi:hypothetical protein
MLGRECFTKQSSTPTPIMEVFCVSGEINGSTSFGQIMSDVGAEGVLKILAVSPMVDLMFL